MCYPVGASQVQEDAPPDRRRERLVRPATPCQPNTFAHWTSWQRPNIGSRVTREGHVRFWGDSLYQSAEWLTLWGLNEAAVAALKLLQQWESPRHPRRWPAGFE